MDSLVGEADLDSNRVAISTNELQFQKRHATHSYNSASFVD